MPNRLTEEAVEMVAERFSMLGEPTRIRLLNALYGEEKTVGELAEEVESGQANVSKHLGLLRRHGMVRRRKEGLHSYYRIADPVVMELCDLVCDRMAEELEVRRDALTVEGREE